MLYTDQLDTTVSFAVGDGIGLAQGRMYLAAHVCGGYQCSGSDPLKLYAVDAAGVGMDYPRARMLGQTPTTQTARSYVALGDSFSAGEGVEPFIPPSDTNGCHRSELAYAKLLDEAPGLNLDLQEFVACSGATTADVRNTQVGGVTQLDALNEDVDIVTVTIGGNDIGFRDFATACVVTFSCDTSSQYQDAVDSIANQLPNNLDALFGAIQARIGSQTRVLVVGYPRLLPYNDGQFPNCAYMSQAERTAASDVTNGLNSAIYAAVSRAGSQFEFVNADANLYGVRISPFAGHELCGDDTYFFGVSYPTDYTFHPNQMGQRAYEELVRDWLITHP